MKKIALVFITAALVALVQYFLPWYTLTIPTFAIGFLSKNRKALPVFFISFWGVFLLWLAMIYFISVGNQFILANRISVLFFKHQWVAILMIINATIGGLVAGSAALVGHYLRDAL